VADPGCLSRIPDPTFFHPGSELSPSRILIKEFKYFKPKKKKKWFLNSKKYDPGCSSRIPDPDADFLPSRIQGSKRHPIPDPGSGSATLFLIIIKKLNLKNSIFKHSSANIIFSIKFLQFCDKNSKEPA
jgi:hypothetical protein